MSAAGAQGAAVTESGDTVSYEFTFQPTSTTSVVCSRCCGQAVRRVGESPQFPGKVLMIVTCGHCRLAP